MTYLGNKLVHTIFCLFLGPRENLEYEVKSKQENVKSKIVLEYTSATTIVLNILHSVW